MMARSLKESARHYRLLLRLRDFAFIGEQNYETDSLRVLAVQLLDFFRFLLSFVLIPSLFLRGHPIRSWIPTRGTLVCHIYWALGSRRALSCCLDLCSSFVVCRFT